MRFRHNGILRSGSRCGPGSGGGGTNCRQVSPRPHGSLSAARWRPAPGERASPSTGPTRDCTRPGAAPIGSSIRSTRASTRSRSASSGTARTHTARSHRPGSRGRRLRSEYGGRKARLARGPATGRAAAPSPATAATGTSPAGPAPRTRPQQGILAIGTGQIETPPRGSRINHQDQCRADHPRSRKSLVMPATVRISLAVAAGRAGYPGRGGGLWLRMVLPSGLWTWLVPSGWTVSVQPSSCSTT